MLLGFGAPLLSTKRKDMTHIVSNSRVALITAASGGIGAACARALADQGYRVALMARNEDVLSIAAELGGFGFQGSVADIDDLARFVQATLERCRIDAVVANTGFPPGGNLLDLSDSDWFGGFELAFLHVVRRSFARWVPWALTEMPLT
jgi:NADP-dependent 3-hydroxy acid dehydrogenase YdfG